MGCWSETCAVSQLPINHRDEVVVLVLARDLHFDPDTPYENRYGPTAAHKVFGFPIYAKYNDYGWIEDEEETALTRWTLDQIDKGLIERDVGENPVRDSAVVRGQMSMDYLGDLVRDDRLSLGYGLAHRDGQRFERSATAIMIRRDVFEGLLREVVVKRWAGESGYVVHTLEHLEADYRNSIATCMEAALVDPSDLWRSKLLVDDRMPREYRQQLGYLFDGLKPDDDRALFFREYTRLLRFDKIMDKLRKGYAPQIGVGSQANDTAPYKALLRVMDAAIKSQDARYDDDDDDAADA